MIRLLMLALLGLMTVLVGCPATGVSDDDDSAGDDDDAADDDDATADDDDATGDDDDATSGDCADDASEDNDSDADPTDLSEGSTADLMSCPDDEDWYTFTTTEAQNISVDVLFLDDEGDIDATLFDDQLDVLDDGPSSSDNEELEYNADAAGTYYVLVEFYEGGDDETPGNAYSIDLTLEAPQVCPVDEFEENDIEDDATAVTEGAHTGLSVCKADDDWYSFPAVASDTLMVDLTFLQADGDIDATLYNPDGSTAGSGITTDDNESIGPVAAPEDGDWIIKVRLYDADPNFSNTYDLTVSTGVVDGR